MEASEKARTMLDQHKLLEARPYLLTCGRSVCPAPVVRDCVDWFNAATAQTPSVQLMAKDENGVELFDVKVLVDGVRVAETLDGVPIEVDPGAHVAVFENSSGARAEQRFVARLADKRSPVSAVLVLAPRRGPLIGTERQLSLDPMVLPAAAPTDHGVSVEGAPSPVRTLGYVSGGLGLAGLAVGAAFGLDAVAKLHEAACVGNVCQDLSAYRAGKAATVGANAAFIGGGILAAVGGVLLLVAPSRSVASQPRTLAVGASVDRSTVGVDLVGAW